MEGVNSAKIYCKYFCHVTIYPQENNNMIISIKTSFKMSRKEVGALIPSLGIDFVPAPECPGTVPELGCNEQA
jgi:hypothetical protein